MKTDLTVIKCNHLGKEVFRYRGILLESEDNRVLLQARFGLKNVKLVDIPISQGDYFLETYYSDRWYNVYEIQGKVDHKLKGWYCNVSYPAVFKDDTIIFRDLALDLLVYPDGRQLVLDRDEFATLKLPPQDEKNAETGLAELQERFRQQFAK